MATTTATAADVRAAAQLLLTRVQALRAAESAAIEQALELIGLVDAAPFPRLNQAILQMAEAILGDLDGSSGSVFESEHSTRDVKTLLELIDLARQSNG